MAAKKALTVKEYRAKLKDGKSKMKHFAVLHNAWRKIVKRRYLRWKDAKKADSSPRVVGDNKVIGGKAEERLLYAMEYAHRTFRLYYSESGTWTKGFGLTNVPSDAFRSDCSWWYTMLRYACGLQGPSLSGGFTGTILSEGKIVTRGYAEKHVGVAVVYGSGDGFHVGSSTGDGPNVFQHGVPEVDTGTFDQFGAGTEVRYRAFPNKPL